MANPTWAPSVAQVADYVTSRTLDYTTPGADSPVGTFTANTYPTIDQVSRMIAGSCAWVAAGLSHPLSAQLNDAAQTVAAIRTAGFVELTYPERDNDINTAEVLLRQAVEALAVLDAANSSQLLVDGVLDSTPTVLIPSYSFPEPTWHGDRNL